MRAQLKALAREQIKGNILQLFVIRLVTSLIIGGVIYLPMLILTTLGGILQSNVIIISSVVLIYVIVFIFSTAFSIGVVKIHLDLAKGVKPKFEMLEFGFLNLKSSLILMLQILWRTLLCMLVFIVPFIAIEYIPALSSYTEYTEVLFGARIIFLVIFYALTIFLLLRYSMADYIFIENPEMRPSDALKESVIITTGRKWEIFVLGLSFIFWILLVTITCGIASIYVFPYIEATLVNYYNSIKRNIAIADIPDDEEPDETDDD